MGLGLLLVFPLVMIIHGRCLLRQRVLIYRSPFHLSYSFRVVPVEMRFNGEMRIDFVRSVESFMVMPFEAEQGQDLQKQV